MRYLARMCWGEKVLWLLEYVEVGRFLNTESNWGRSDILIIES